MGFVTPALLGGALLIGVPIVLHLVMRREAQQLVFPALRFIQKRQTLNQHRLQLRQLLLLALRCAIICLLAFALARPTLRGSAASGDDENKPLAAALVFDNSLRMAYLHDNQTRLEQARELGLWLVEQFPNDCPLAVMDRAMAYGSRDLDRSGAELRIERLVTNSVSRPMEDTLNDATDWLRQQTDHRGEIYIFTDLAEAAWSPDVLSSLAARLDELPGAKVYLIDVGAERPHNLAIAPPRLSSEELAPGSLMQIDTELLAVGDAGGSEELTAELYLEDAAGGAQKRGQQVVRVPSGDETTSLEFSVSGMELGTHQGYVRLVGDDPLYCDNVRYFTVEVRPPRKILLLGEQVEDTVFLSEALSPSSAAGLLKSKFDCRTEMFAAIDALPLADYSAVCLLDPPPLSAAAWQSLTDYAHGGGGVGVFLGRHAKRDEFNEAAPQQLLAAKLRWQSRDATYLRPSRTNHSALRELSALGDAVPWPEFPVFKYWELEEAATDAFVLVPFANSQPAIVERPVGSGRAITMTTPLSDPAYNNPWNVLPTAPDPWPFLALANGVVEYLAGANEGQLNYLAGQTALLRLAPEEQVSSYVLELPGARAAGRRGTAVRQSLTPGQTELAISSTDVLGNYRVRSGGRQGQLDRGFSVNCAGDVSQLARADFATIQTALGKDRVRLARTRREIEVRVGQGRRGRELFAPLIVAVALALAGELLLANRFYRSAA